MRSGDALGAATGGKPSPAGLLGSEATPALVLDHDLLIANVAAMAERARTAGVALWPHAKTHKCAQIAGLQRQHGAAGITVATLAEAEYFAAAGFHDILLAYPPVGDWRLVRLTDLARRTRVRVVLDDAGVLAGLIEACRAAGVVIGYLWEVDCGTGRLGTAPGAATAAAIAGAPCGPECPFAGLMTFGGHAYAAADDAELDRAAEDERTALEVSADALTAAGVDCPVRSAGTTPTAHRLRAGTAPSITEMRPGNYVFYDATQVALGLVGPAECALSVLATVIGRPDPRRVILDAGSKALSAERLTPRAPGFGLVLGHAELTVERLYEQHAIVSAPQPSELRVGERVRIVPNHACTTANLHRRALVAEGDELVDIWSIGAAGPGG
jgi:D-serine deaminase-like pyridoxal phosphate-dependent protein